MNASKIVFASLVIVLITGLGCNVSGMPFSATPTPIPSQTPYPTYTPYPPLTPYPTFTALPPTATTKPERWKVRVISVIRADKFGTWSFKEDQKSEFIIATIEYTYQGQEIAEFSPQSVLLLFAENSTYPGAAIPATNYQPENNNAVVNFTSQGAVSTTIKPGETKREKFGWGLRLTSDKKFRILFPETEAIEITVSD